MSLLKLDRPLATANEASRGTGERLDGSQAWGMPICLLVAVQLYETRIGIPLAAILQASTAPQCPLSVHAAHRAAGLAHAPGEKTTSESLSLGRALAQGEK